MGDVVQMLRAGGPPKGPNLVYGYVSYSQPAPAGWDDPLFVIDPDFSTEINFQCVHWPKIHGATIPAQGADVLLVFDNRRNPRCLWWAGATTPWPT